MIAGSMNVTVPDGFWEPVRLSVLNNVLGFAPSLIDGGIVTGPPQVVSGRPVVTYISRQGGGRLLVEKDHKAMVDALQALASEGICEFHIATMERLSLKAQLELVARSTVSSIALLSFCS